MFPELHSHRSEYFTGAATIAAPSLPTISVQTCLDSVEEYSSTQKHDGADQSPQIVGWLLFEDTPILMSYADAIEQGRETVLLLSNGTLLRVTSLNRNGTIQCAASN